MDKWLEEFIEEGEEDFSSFEDEFEHAQQVEQSLRNSSKPIVTTSKTIPKEVWEWKEFEIKNNSYQEKALRLESPDVNYLSKAERAAASPRSSSRFKSSPVRPSYRPKKTK